MQDNKVALVIVNYNDCPTTKNFLNLILNFRNIHHIIVVDNASTDDSYEELKKYRSNKIDVIKSEKNSGYAAGNNYGAFYAIEKYNPECLIISNPDVEFSEEFVDRIVSFTISEENAGMVSGVMKSLANIKAPLIAWRRPGFYDLVLSNFILLRRLIGNRTMYKDEELNQDINPVGVIPGSLFAIRSDVFQAVSGFDEETFLYEEENILSHRLNSCGYINYLLRNCSYLHIHAVSINKAVPKVEKRLDIDFESRMIYAEKYLKLSNIQNKILELTYRIGKFNYLAALKFLNINR